MLREPRPNVPSTGAPLPDGRREGAALHPTYALREEPAKSPPSAAIACYAALSLDVLKRDAFASQKGGPGLSDLSEEGRVLLQPVFEPVVLGLKADQHACGPTVPSNHDLFSCGHP